MPRHAKTVLHCWVVFLAHEVVVPNAIVRPWLIECATLSAETAEKMGGLLNHLVLGIRLASKFEDW